MESKVSGLVGLDEAVVESGVEGQVFVQVLTVFKWRPVLVAEKRLDCDEGGVAETLERVPYVFGVLVWHNLCHEGWVMLGNHQGPVVAAPRAISVESEGLESKVR